MKISYINMVQPTNTNMTEKYPQQQIFKVILSVANAYVNIIKNHFYKDYTTLV